MGNSSSLRVGISADYLEINSAGHLTLSGEATVWEDMRVPMTAVRVGGASDPDWVQFKDDGAGSVGVFTYQFDKATDEHVFFTVQLPHQWQYGGEIEPHVHWCPTDTDTGDVVWSLEYTWQDINGTFGNTTIVTVTDAADGTAYKHQVSDFASIDGAGLGASSMLVCRLFRDANNAADTYDADAALLEFDFHYTIDKLGSDDEYPA